MQKRTKKKLIALSIFILASIALLSIEPLYTPTALISSKELTHLPKYIALQALVSGDLAGNTIEATRDALGSKVQGIEIDVRLSKDNIPFLYDSDDLSQQTNGTGRPEDHTWNELSKLTYKNPTHSHLLKLDDVFKLAGTKKFIFIDVKTTKLIDRVFAKVLVDLIHKYHLQEKVVIESSSPFFLALMRLQARDIIVMYDFITNSVGSKTNTYSDLNEIPWLLKQSFIQKQIRRIIRPDLLGTDCNIDRKLLKHLVKSGYPVICLAKNDLEISSSLFALNIAGIQTNIPLQLMDHNYNETKGVLYDVGGTESTGAHLIHVHSKKDIIDAINYAKSNNLPITIAGRRHSMGGQTLLNNSVQLNMLGFNEVEYDFKSKTVRAQAGASWKKIQAVLDAYDRSVKIMQSDNIFTVGGSVSVNVHGWQTGMPPIASTIVVLKAITADGEEIKLSMSNNPQLFKAIIGGYGMFAIITEVEFTTTQNSMLKFSSEFMHPKDFITKFQQKVTDNPNAELAFGRLSVDRSNLFDEAGLFWYEKVNDNSAKTQKIEQESLVAIKRAIFRASEYIDLGKKMRWSAEKIYARNLASASPTTRNNIMNSDIHVLWPLYGNKKDILHEYFIPKNEFMNFLLKLKGLLIDNYEAVNLLNVTIREVKADSITMLNYAKNDVFAFVLLFSQEKSNGAEQSMIDFTNKLIDEVIKLNGTFYLPYRLHYSSDQFHKCYPNADEWFALKDKWDPNRLFDSIFFKHIHK